MVKIAECKCNDCPKEFNLFRIVFKKNVPPWHIMCPVCGSENITIHWIDKNYNKLWIKSILYSLVDGEHENSNLIKDKILLHFYLKNKEIYKIFNYKELSIELHPEVYDPAEDTFLIIESINVREGDSVLEIGTGCGIIALECARIGANVICSDINLFATKLVKHNYQKNKTFIKGELEVRSGDLFNVVKDHEKFDIIIFNPPYLPIKRNDYTGGLGWIDVATNGGIDGLFLIKKYIGKLKNHLKKHGKAYFVFSSLSDRKKLEIILKKTNFKYKIIKSQKFLDEIIDVYQINF